jgi:trehalose 6-phosphate synthase
VARLVAASYRVAKPKSGGGAGGLAVGLADALKATRGLWFGWSGTTHAEPPARAEVQDIGGVSYATVDLATADHGPFYAGYSNGTLWPLLHYRLGLVTFDRAAFAAYLRVNAHLAAALMPLLRPDDIVWVHDYQLLTLGAELRRQGFQGRIGFFLHVPFPAADIWRALPQGDRLLHALLECDLLGFQTEADRNNFAYCVAHLHGVPLDGTTLHPRAGRAVETGAFPIGIDTTGFARLAARAAGGKATRQLRDSLVDRALIIGADRLDYSKGLTSRFHGFEHLLNTQPSLRRKVTYLQVAARSRAEVAEYRALRRDLDQLAGRINGEHADFDWTPLRYMTRDLPRTTLAGFFRSARIGLVTPMRDGMNLVAKEYVAAQDPTDPGVLVLSQFAGAAQELKSALQVNPIDAVEIAEALAAALAMSVTERRARWEAMMGHLSEATAASWAQAFLARLRAVGRDPVQAR